MITRKRVLTLTQLVFLFFLLSPITASCEPEIKVWSKWLVKPVILDGKISSNEEWSDAAFQSFTLGANEGKNYPYHKIGLWVKNDETHLYMLYRVTYPDYKYSIEDYAFIYYLWPFEGPTGWEHSDRATIYQNLPPEDWHGFNGADWINDESATPPGTNNVEGTGRYDGQYYWFEFRTELESSEPIDWSLTQGETYGWNEGTEEKGDRLSVGLHDESTGLLIERFILLTLAKKFNPPVGGELDPMEKSAIILPWLVKGTATLIIATMVIRKIRETG